MGGGTTNIGRYVMYSMPLWIPIMAVIIYQNIEKLTQNSLDNIYFLHHCFQSNLFPLLIYLFLLVNLCVQVHIWIISYYQERFLKVWVP